MKVRGFHGTTATAAASLLKGDDFWFSTNEGDWLGSGVYFFQDAPERAEWWAKEACQEGDTPVVLEAEIDLSDGLDLLDLWGFDELSHHYSKFSEQSTAEQRPLELSGGKVKHLAGQRLVDRNKRDCAFIDYAVTAIETVTRERVRSVRSSFLWGRALYEQSFLFDWSNVQIAVRDRSTISPPVRHDIR